MENRFNLIDEPWIPVADFGQVSLRQIFSNQDYRSLGGNPVQKIAILKLLLAIAQATSTPKNNAEWRAIGAQGLSKRCIEYLEKWYDRFYLFGNKPFLQMPQIITAKLQPYGALIPEVATGNTTLISQVQIERSLDDGSKALLLLTLMGFALSGKKTDNKVVLTPNYTGKTNDKGKGSTGKPGPSMAHMGLLHSFLLGANIQQTLWLNLFTHTQLAQNNLYPHGIGTPPWEKMPEGEDCEEAKILKQSLIGRLIPVCRFCLLTEEGIHYSEGISHPSYKEGVADPSVAINHTGKEPKALWVNPDKRPWRELTALLGFFNQSDTQGFESQQISGVIDRVRDVTDHFSIWSGGLRVSSNAGEQYVSGSDDFVESQVLLDNNILGEPWFDQLKQEMDGLEALAKNLYGRILGYSKALTVDGTQIARRGSHLFWQLCERDFHTLVKYCEQTHEAGIQRHQLRRRYASYAQYAYDQFCPRETARQLDAWAQFCPNHAKYLK